ncbi:MAG: ABC transporter ATP-binding protein [Gammaproteobacteria bacterium]|nr:ABC transporter ATP-binding protein [Gammaproteobacteria bacterium]
MAEPLLRAIDLVKAFGGLMATDHLSLDVGEGEVHALIGPNGAGKTTIVGQLVGELRPDSGRIEFAGEDLGALSPPARLLRGLARTFQISQLLLDDTAADNVALAVQARAGHSFRFWRDARADPRLRDEARRHLVDVGLGAVADRRAADLSHGQHKQLELAVALASRPRLLLLDEPMAGLGPTETQAMIGLLAGLKGRVTMLLIEHDMEAVFALADLVTVLASGRLIASGPPARIRDDPLVRDAYLGDGDA